MATRSRLSGDRFQVIAFQVIAFQVMAFQVMAFQVMAFQVMGSRCWSSGHCWGLASANEQPGKIFSDR